MPFGPPHREGLNANNQNIDAKLESGEMILDIKGTIVNAFIEPQFEEVSSGHLVTVEFSDLGTLGRFKRHMQGGTRI